MSIPSRLIRSLGSPRRRKGSGSLEVEMGVWNSHGGGKDKHLFFFPPTFLSLSHIELFFSFNSETDSYATNNSV